MMEASEQDRDRERKASRSGGKTFIRAAGVFIFAAVFFFCGVLVARFCLHKNDILSVVDDAMDAVRSEFFYYNADTEAELKTGALKGIAAYLDDPYAAYYTAEEYAEMLKSDSGSYVGIGIVISLREDGSCAIDSVTENSPASLSGLMAGDVLKTVNGTATEGLTLEGVSALFQIEEGAQNTIGVQRGGELLSISVQAGEVYTPFVHSRMLNGNIGYIHISAFHGKAAEEVGEALVNLCNQGMEKLVLDVRDNPGGTFSVVIAVAEQFLPRDSLIATLRNRNGNETAYRTKNAGTDLPIAMLVNGYSASASELLAGALHDNSRAVLFGTQTYGKGIVQTFFALDGQNNGVLKLTTEAYYTPAGICIQDAGIAPDYIIQMPEDTQYSNIYELSPDADPQLTAATEYLSALQ